MLSSDGLVMENRNVYGGILRDEAGTPIFCYLSHGNEKSVLFEELKAVEEGLKGALRVGIGKITHCI